MNRTIKADLILAGAAEVLTFRDVPRGRVHEAVETSTLRDASVAVRCGKVVFVGDAATCRKRVRLKTSGEEIDCSGQVVLPGLIDAHTHLPFAGDRSHEFRLRLRGARYEDIARAGGGILSTVRDTRAADEDELVEGCLRRMDRLLLHGVTQAEAKSGYGLTLKDEVRQLRAIARADRNHPVDLHATLLAAHVLPGEFAGRRAAYVELITSEIIPTVARRELARFCDVFVEEGAFTVEEARTILSAGVAHGLAPRLHVDQLSAAGGAELAASLSAASADHLDHVSAAGIAALAAAGTTAVILPAATFFLRRRVYPPAIALMEAGVPVAIATDCNPGTCMTENLPLAATIACLTTGMDTDEALAGITIQAARSLGLESTHGTLEPGRQADLAVFDVPERTDILYHFGINHCRNVVKNGQVVVRDARRLPEPAVELETS
ncbi:MAG: imidazolonepropionase [Acidobacteriota bacterium]